jgi:hypothetical protein
MARGDLKTGRPGSRTPFQILADYYQAGDSRDGNLWREFGRVTRSLAAVRWSRGLRVAMLGPAKESERTDEELAAEDVGGNLLAVIQFPVWSRIRTVGLEHAVLVAAEDGGMAAVNARISQAGCGHALSPPNLAAEALPNRAFLKSRCNPHCVR